MTAALTTYRYLRLALLVLVLALGVAVVAETVRQGWETSISAYYYTAAGPVFVAALAGIGVCLVCLRGHTDAEDVALNLAGLSAPMVAFVPTPAVGHPPDIDAIVNNAATYLAVLAVGYVVVVIFGVRSRRHGRPGWPSPWGWVGLVSTALAWGIGVVWLATDHASFAAHAHLLAAGFTFVPFGAAVVLTTGWGRRVLAGEASAEPPRYDAAYRSITLALIVVVGLGLALGLTDAWEYAAIAAEGGVLVLFGAFWILQTLAGIERRDAPSPGA